MVQLPRLLQDHFWVAKAATTVALAGLLASATSAVIGARIIAGVSASPVPAGAEDDAEPDDEDAASTPRATLARAQIGPRRDAESTIARNPFCPSCLPPGEAPPVTPDGPGDPLAPGPAVAMDGVRSELPLLLVATMEAVDPANSRATLRSNATGSSGLVWPGSQIAVGVEVVGIERGRVLLVNNGRREYIPVGELPPEKPKTAARAEAPASAKPAAKPRDAGIPGAAEAIRCDGGGGSCTVERDFVEGLLKNPMQAAREIRVAPAQRDGEAYGFRLGRVRPGTLPQLLGLETGDVVLAVNGYELNSIDGAMGLLGKLRRATNLEVSIERKGKTMTKAVKIE